MFLFKRGKYYHLEYLDDNENRIRRISTGATKKPDAIRFLTEYKKQIEKHNKPKHILLSTFSKKYQEYIATNCSKKYLLTVSLAFRQLSDSIGDIPLIKLTYHQLDQFMNTTFKRTQHGAWTNYRALKSAFNKAMNWGYITMNPLNRIQLPKISISPPLFIKKEEFDMIVKQTDNPDLKDIFITAFNSGMRLSEIINLQWSSVNLSNRTLLVQNHSSFKTKNKKPRIIPINNTLYQLLKSRMPKVIDMELNEYVFAKYSGVTYSVEFVRKGFKKIVMKLGLNSKYHFHLLRVSFGSNLLANGIPISNISKLLGYSSKVVTEKHYTNLSIENLSNAVKSLDKKAV